MRRRRHWLSTYDREYPWLVVTYGRTHDGWWPPWRSTRVLGRSRVEMTCAVCGTREVVTARIPRFGPVPVPAGGRHPLWAEFLRVHEHPDRGAPMSWALPLLNPAVHVGGLDLSALAMRLDADIMERGE